MSTKNLYFLPSIQRLKAQANRYSGREDHSKHRLRSIEQVILNQTTEIEKKQKMNKSISIEKKKIKRNENMYDKYFLLPKIMANRYGKE